MSILKQNIDTVRASRAGHTFHERWTARRCLQLVFPKDDLVAIAIEGLSINETINVSSATEDIADLILYYGNGDTFDTCSKLQTLQFKYTTTSNLETSSYLKKTIEKFADSILDYDKHYSKKSVNKKVSFSFITNGEFSKHLQDAIDCLKLDSIPAESKAKRQYLFLKKWVQDKKVDPKRLFSLIQFCSLTSDLLAQNNSLQKSVKDWSAGCDGPAKERLFNLVELVRKKAGLEGQKNNLIKREDILVALGCDEEELFPAPQLFVDVKNVIEREELSNVCEIIKNAKIPVFLHADGGVGKTVFVQSIANKFKNNFEVVVFDCFGGGAYRSESQARHLPNIGLLQIINELSSNGLCDPLLSGDSDVYGLIKAVHKRLVQASQSMKQQNKEGVLIIIDAADNAQLEADRRNDKSFPRLLLDSLNTQPISGVKLLLTSREYRMDDVIGRNKVKRVELLPFSVFETKSFLKSKRTNIVDLEFQTALARSKGNARVLDHLVASWEKKITNATSSSVISVTELIKEKCDGICHDLHINGWSDSEIKLFFAAISLLPPPIPLNELARALGWSKSQVNSAISDLDPLVELVKYGVIFRDEPTETYINETYANNNITQQQIAERLEESQNESAYAAEALPHFLLVINDTTRAFDLALSTGFPKSIDTPYGRRKLKLSRLNAALSLSVKDNNIDRVLQLIMGLAQVTAANEKGDQFVRRVPYLASMLGGRDASRRLFNDRSGWRGARDTRLIISYGFQNDMEEANIHLDKAIKWFNWSFQNNKEDGKRNSKSPDVPDYAAIIFMNIMNGNMLNASENLAKWDLDFSLKVANEVVKLCAQHEANADSNILQKIARFSATKICKSLALQIALLSNKLGLNDKQLKSIARATSALTKEIEIPSTNNYNNGLEEVYNFHMARASFAALCLNSRQSSKRIFKLCKLQRPSRYDYGERHQSSKGWISVLSVCVKAWSENTHVSFHHLLPREISISKRAKYISDEKSLNTFLKEQVKEVYSPTRKKIKDSRLEERFNYYECNEITEGILLILNLIQPIEEVIFSRQPMTSKCLNDFLEIWEDNLSIRKSKQYEDAKNNLSKNTGLGLISLILKYTQNIGVDEAQRIIEILNNHCYSISEKRSVLELLTPHSNLHDIIATFALEISDDILKDEYVEQRGQNYSDLAESLMLMNKDEAQEYYKLGLSQLDQMGGDDYDFINWMLLYAAEQSGGKVRPQLGHRLMNLCQTICYHEPSKYGWTLFGNAIAKSVGIQALYKLVRWHDQDISPYSYGLPQLACFLCENDDLDPERAALLLSLCDDEGWHDWKIGEGVGILLDKAKPNKRKVIFSIIIEKLRAEHSFGAMPSTWKSLIANVKQYPEIMGHSEFLDIQQLKEEAQRRQDAQNSGIDVNITITPQISGEKVDPQKRIDDIVMSIAESCDLTCPNSLDEALVKVKTNTEIEYYYEQSFIDRLRSICSYDERYDFTKAICEATELKLDVTIDCVVKNIQLWKKNTLSLREQTKDLISLVFSFKGSKLFDLKYSGISRQIRKLEKTCGDSRFVMDLVLKTIVTEHIELGGVEWLQIASSLCKQSSSGASLSALEELLGSSTAQIGDEIGEGIFNLAFQGSDSQTGVIADIIWHLLGDTDAFTRWNAARAIERMVDLELFEDIEALCNRFDEIEVDALISKETKLSYRNSQQWFLMGLSRASINRGSKLHFLRRKLEKLGAKADLHVINKLHIARVLSNVEIGVHGQELQNLWSEVKTPPHGYLQKNGWPKQKESNTNFRFDYDFNKWKVSELARLFGISENEARDSIVKEIHINWPNAENMDYFSGPVHYGNGDSERYESYREHIQRHAFLSAVTTLLKLYPIVRDSYDAPDYDPWSDWLKKHDVSFDDGSWLADRKDNVPEHAKNYLLNSIPGGEDSLKCREELIKNIGFLELGIENQGQTPLSGYWKTKDDVHVRITSALATPKGVIERCKEFSKSPYHDLWLPTYNSEGLLDVHVKSSQFDPFIWEPSIHRLGIDEADKLATTKATARSQLGLDLTKRLGITPDPTLRNWFDQNGNIILRSQVWGGWEPNPDVHNRSIQNEGTMLWASSNWLDVVLEKLNKKIIYSIEFTKYKSNHSYKNTAGIHSIYVGLRDKNSQLRLWKAVKASNVIS